MASDGYFYDSTMSKFPHPTMPFDALALDTPPCTGSRSNQKFPEKCDYSMQQYPCTASEAEGTVDVDDNFQSLQILMREFAEEFDVKGQDILDKFFSKLERNVPRDHHRMIKEIMEELRGKAPGLSEKLCSRLNPTGVLVNHPVTAGSERGVKLASDSTDAEEQGLKLERFKVRTVNQGGVVKVLSN